MIRAQRQNRIVSALWLSGIAALIVVAFVWQARNDAAYEAAAAPAERAKHRREDAWIRAQSYVEASLKAPSTASFGWQLDDQCTVDGVVYACKGWVDAQNSFGAMLRNRFVVKLKDLGSSFELISIDLR